MRRLIFAGCLTRSPRSCASFDSPCSATTNSTMRGAPPAHDRASNARRHSSNVANSRRRLLSVVDIFQPVRIRACRVIGGVWGVDLVICQSQNVGIESRLGVAGVEPSHPNFPLLERTSQNTASRWRRIAAVCLRSSTGSFRFAC